MIQPGRMLRILWLAACAAAMLLLPAGAAAQSSIKPAPPGSFTTVSAGPGLHYDPHVSGNLVTYGETDYTVYTVRYFDLVAKADHAVPNSYTFDFLPDVSGSTIVFTRQSSSASSIYKFDTSTAGSPTEVNPAPRVARQSAQIGRNVIAYQDFCSGSSAAIIAYDTSTSTATNVSSCTFLNQEPAISPDGTALTWEKCASVNSTCNIWSATKSGSNWVTHQLTSGANTCLLPGSNGPHPDTNGQVVVYSCNRGTGDHLYWQPVTGGTEQSFSNVLAQESYPSIAGQFVAFAGIADPPRSCGGFLCHDIYVLDISSLNLYQITSGGGDKQLNDISITSDGKVNVVWQQSQADSYAVYAYTFSSSVEFATFSAQGAINPSKKQFAVGGQFTLGNGSSGFDLSTQDVTLQLVEDHGPGNFSITIPAGQGPGHFQHAWYGQCVFYRTINGVQLAAAIGPFPGNTCQSASLGPYSYGFAGQGANNLPTTNTVTVTLGVGNNTGSKSINALFFPGSN